MKLYRWMKADADGKPLKGERFGTLGVRPKGGPGRPDVEAQHPDDIVSASLPKGMSVSTDPNMPQSPGDEFLLWEIDSAALGPVLRPEANPTRTNPGPLHHQAHDGHDPARIPGRAGSDPRRLAAGSAGGRIMITIDDVRTAVLSPDPAGKLDGLVRNELAAGKTTGEIYAALLPITRAIRKAQPLPENVDEILLGTLDALTGHCDPDYCYKDPPTTPANGAAPRTPADGRPAEVRPPV